MKHGKRKICGWHAAATYWRDEYERISGAEPRRITNTGGPAMRWPWVSRKSLDVLSAALGKAESDLESARMDLDEVTAERDFQREDSKEVRKQVAAADAERDAMREERDKMRAERDAMRDRLVNYLVAFEDVCAAWREQELPEQELPEGSQ